MTVHACTGCGEAFDDGAALHHATHMVRLGSDPGCDWITTACTWHDLDCPWLDPEQRFLGGGWTSRQRDCAPVYAARLHQGRMVWSLTPEAKQQPQKAPRPWGKP